MARHAFGEHHRKGIGLRGLFRMFSDDATARTWIESIVWPDGPHCPRCGLFNVQSEIAYRTMTHRCRECEGKPLFSVKTGTVMQLIKLGYRTWAVAAHMVRKNPNGVSSMKLHRDLDVTQKSAWHLAHRLRKTHEADVPIFHGSVGAAETCCGGKERNRHSKKKLRAGRGTVGKMSVARIRDRATNEIRARVVAKIDAETLHDFVKKDTVKDTTACIDEAPAYCEIDRNRETVNRSSGDLVNDMAHTNGMESFRAMLKRGHNGIYHKFSRKHLDRYVTELARRHNVWEQGMIVQMVALVWGTTGKRPRYRVLTADNGLHSGVQS